MYDYSFQNLPAPVKKRINALKNLQLDVTNLEAKFYEEVHLLECKYHKLYHPIHEKVNYQLFYCHLHAKLVIT